MRLIIVLIMSFSFIYSNTLTLSESREQIADIDCVFISTGKYNSISVERKKLLELGYNEGHILEVGESLDYFYRVSIMYSEGGYPTLGIERILQGPASKMGINASATINCFELGKLVNEDKKRLHSIKFIKWISSNSFQIKTHKKTINIMINNEEKDLGTISIKL